MLRRLSDLREENARLAWDKANLADVLRRVQQELELEKQANRYQTHTVLLRAPVFGTAAAGL